MSDLIEEAYFATQVVREAGQLAARMRSEGVHVAHKTSVSDVVTDADKAAEELVVRWLSEAFPEDAIVGEEGATREGTSGRRWVIDPVDGTYNFAQGLDWWCSALALAGPDDVLLGAVHDPISDQVHLGGPTLTSTCDGVELPPLEDRGLAESCVATYLHPPFWTGAVDQAFKTALGGAATVRMLGSGSRDLVAVAQGRLHLSVQHSTPDWDWLPGSAIVRGAGGSARQVEAAGVTWSVAGAPTAVAEVCAALASG